MKIPAGSDVVSFFDVVDPTKSPTFRGRTEEKCFNIDYSAYVFDVLKNLYDKGELTTSGAGSQSTESAAVEAVSGIGARESLNLDI